MSVRVRYFAAAAEVAGCEEETVLLPQGATVGQLRSELAQRHGLGMETVMRSGSFLVDSVVSRDLTRPVGARVDVLPPFAGG